MYDSVGLARHLFTIHTTALLRVLMHQGIYVAMMLSAAGFRHLVRHARPESEWFGTLTFGAAVVWLAVTLVADGLMGGAVLDTLRGDADSSAVRALVMGTILIYNGAIAFTITGLFLVSAASATLDSGVLPRRTGWLGYAAAALCLVSVPAMFTGPVDATGLYNPGGWGPAIIANFPPLCCFVTRACRWPVLASRSTVGRPHTNGRDQMKHSGLRRAVTWSAIGSAAIVSSAVFVHRAIGSVRATGDESTRPFPGDDLIPNPRGVFTNAVTIHARPDQVWPWLAQMGAGRAGWYSYDRLDNGGEPSACRIVPELQHLEVGMVFPAGPGITDGFTLVAFEPERFLVLEWKARDGVRLVSWAFALEPLNGMTRLIVRVRGGRGYGFFGLSPTLTQHIVPVVHAVHFIMQRRQLLGIAYRAATLGVGGES
jgi:hypothetical protein